ncbi:MAG: hypothetical protein G01um101470_437 [Parcubacteria group bacterium Gr01-1014_70]|nr:MAG: hypothetical protein G01um101470_437 [Parcubacteria group bacterium Gr01-1014_70]
MRNFTKICIFAIAIIPFTHIAVAKTTVVENHVTSFANSSGNSATGGGTVETGDAHASVQVESRTNGGEGTVKVDASATVNGESKTFSETFEGDASVDIEVTASSSEVNYVDPSSHEVSKDSVEVTHVSISRIPAEQNVAGKRIFGELISALKNFFSYVATFFKK